MLTGPRNPEQLRQNLDALHQGPLDPQELAWVRAHGQKVKAKKRLDCIP